MACRLDLHPRNRVETTRVRAGPHLVQRRALRAPANGVGLPQGLGQLARRKRPRAVGAVAVHFRPEVDDDGLAGAELALARVVVRQGRIGARGDDRREGDVIGALVVDRPHDPPRDVGLGPAHDTLLGKPGEDAVDDLRRPTNRVQLAGLLDRAQHERHGRDRDELHPCREKLGVPGNRQVIGLERDRPAPISPSRLARPGRKSRSTIWTSTPSTARAASA